jgi:anti-anti-sigma factor
MKIRKIKATRELVDGEVNIIHISGSVVTNLGTASVKKLVVSAVRSANTPKLILNLSDVHYMDSFSFGWIMQVYKEIREKGGDFALCCPNKDILYMFKLTEFSRVVPAYHTEKEATEAMRTENQAKRITYI